MTRPGTFPTSERDAYDQALVSRVFVDAHLVTKNPLYRRVACELFDFVLGELQAPGGGFYSARDADSEGVEGKYYVWTKAEILASLGPEEGELFCDYYGVTAEGNWRDPHAPGEAKNVLHVQRSLEEFARNRGADPAELEPRLAAARRKLLAVRSGRVPPALDDKILVEWNDLMIASLRARAALSERKMRRCGHRRASSSSIISATPTPPPPMAGCSALFRDVRRANRLP